ncbi:MAG: adenylate/guanylate cyclase domain-containing protein [Nitriliruptor sp.]
METRWIVAIVVASVLVAALVGWLIWRAARRGAAAAKRAVVTRTDDGFSLGGTLPPLVLEPVQAITAWVDVVRPQLLPALAADGTITLVFSDVEGSTALNHELGDARFHRLIAAHERFARKLARDHDGRLVKSQGDGLMLAFKRPPDAVRFAAAFQRALAGDALEGPLRVRMGIHTGEAKTRQGDFFGANVAFAARVCGEADGGQILVSEAVNERVDGQLELPIERGRKASLRGIPGRHRLHPVEWRQ